MIEKRKKLRGSVSNIIRLRLLPYLLDSVFLVSIYLVVIHKIYRYFLLLTYSGRCDIKDLKKVWISNSRFNDDTVENSVSYLQINKTSGRQVDHFKGQNKKYTY